MPPNTLRNSTLCCTISTRAATTGLRSRLPGSERNGKACSIGCGARRLPRCDVAGQSAAIELPAPVHHRTLCRYLLAGGSQYNLQIPGEHFVGNENSGARTAGVCILGAAQEGLE